MHTTIPVCRDGGDLSSWSEESKTVYAQALQGRHRGMYQEAVNALERIIEVSK